MANEYYFNLSFIILKKKVDKKCKKYQAKLITLDKNVNFEYFNCFNSFTVN